MFVAGEKFAAVREGSDGADRRIRVHHGPGSLLPDRGRDTRQGLV